MPPQSSCSIPIEEHDQEEDQEFMTSHKEEAILEGQIDETETSKYRVHKSIKSMLQPISGMKKSNLAEHSEPSREILENHLGPSSDRR